MNLIAQAMTPSAFAPFGQLLAAATEGRVRHPYLGQSHNGRSEAELNITFMRIALSQLPTTISHLERHPHSNQLFVPLNGTGQVIIVCPSDTTGQPDLNGLRAFFTHGGQAINYNHNVWHAPRMAISGTGEFVMLRWDCDTPQDTEWLKLDDPITLAMP